MIVLDAAFEKSAPRLADAPPSDLPEICFAGRSNVGKSSALNVLTQRKQLARVSKTPGRTRLLNFFKVTLADRPGPKRRTAEIRLCDLPGYGFAKAPKDERRAWGAMIGEYLTKRDALAAVVVLVDLEIGPQAKDLEMMEMLRVSTRPFIVAATKADRLSRTRLGGAVDKVARLLEVPREAVLPFSSAKNIGHDALWMAICAASGVLGKQSGLVLEANEEEAS